MNWTPSGNEVFACSPETDLPPLIRILWSPGVGDIAYIGLDGIKSDPDWIDSSELERLFIDGLIERKGDPAELTGRTNSSLTLADRDIRNRRFDIIRPLVDDPRRLVLYRQHRGGLIQARATEARVSKKQIYKALRCWWQGGQHQNALVPNFAKCGAPGRVRDPGVAKRGRPRYSRTAGTNFTLEMRAKVKLAAPLLSKLSWAAAYEEWILLYFSDRDMLDGLPTTRVYPPEQIPSFDQFRYWGRRLIPPDRILKGRVGEKKYQQRHRERTGTTRDSVPGPGDVFEIDATIANVHLRSRQNPKLLIGRPTFYIIVDRYSRMIVGLTVALSAPSWKLAKLAIENALTDKVSFCARFGIEISEDEWPCHHLPTNLFCDRGSEFLGKDIENAAAALGFTLSNAPAYRPDLKGLVESRFEILDKELLTVPGRSHPRDRSAQRHELDAVYTIESFTRLMINHVRKYNEGFVVANPPSDWVSPDGKSATPLRLWHYGVQKHGAPRLMPRDQIRMNLLDSGTLRLSDTGALFGGLHYEPESPSSNGLFERTPGRKWQEREVRHDPCDVSSIFVAPKDKGPFEKWILTPADEHYRGWTSDEVKLLRTERRIEKERFLSDRMSIAARTADDNARITAEARALLPDGHRAKGAKPNRAARQEDRRALESEVAWTRSIGPTPIAAGPSVAVATRSTPDRLPQKQNLRINLTARLRAVRDASKPQMTE